MVALVVVRLEVELTVAELSDEKVVDDKILRVEVTTELVEVVEVIGVVEADDVVEVVEVVEKVEAC